MTGGGHWCGVVPGDGDTPRPVARGLKLRI